MSLKIQIIDQKEYRKKLKFLLPYISILLMAGYAWSFNTFFPDISSTKIFIAISGLVGFFWICFLIYCLFFMETYKVIGNILFENAYVNLDKISISIENIKVLRFIIQGYYGDSSVDTLHFGGDNNWLFIKLNNGDTYRYNVFLKSKRQLSFIKRFTNEYKAKGIIVEFIK